MAEVSKFQFITPTTISVIGPTGSGKTVGVLEMISHKDALFTTPPKRIIWYYGIYNDIFDQHKNQIEFIEGIENLANLDTGGEPTLVVVDDLMDSMNLALSKAFTQDSHHKNFTIMYLSQVLYQKKPIARVISLNSHYLVLYKSKRDALSLSRLSSQLFPRAKNLFYSVYSMSTHQPYSYLVVNLHPALTGTSAQLHHGILPTQIEHLYTI
jgi:hypothetical protein